MTATKIVNVAAGVLMRPDGHVLLAQRPAGKPYEGWWEFPGGKFEPGENAEVAVTRELEEELGIRVLASSPWVVREHVYEHAHVRLFFRRITGKASPVAARASSLPGVRSIPSISPRCCRPPST